ncbi:MAG: polysaccharide deacetylase family protein [Rhodothermales bacterium]
MDVRPSLVPKMRFALRMLLVPLGLEPDWIEEDRVDGALYYGANPERASAARVVFPYASSAAPFFERTAPFDVKNAARHRLASREVPVFFVDEHGRPDLVASSFLWLSGWQEWTDGRRDEHGRVRYADALSAQFDTALHPVVDAYRVDVERQLQAGGMEVKRRRWGDDRWAFCATHDVDYLRKWRPGILYREFVDYLLLNRRGDSFAERIRRTMHVLGAMGGQDPYRRAMEEMPRLVTDKGGTATYFVKSGGEDPHDVPYRVDSTFMRTWLARLAASGFEVGLHPSYVTVDEPKRLESEKQRLDRVASRPVVSVRQHYLRFDPATTPALYDRLGFEVDSTLGFAEHEGFRRGTCLPYQLYDLERDRPTKVWEMPLGLMDSALFNRRRLSADQALRAVQELASACKQHGGVLVGLWHTTLGDEMDHPGWKAHFIRSLDHATEEGAAMFSLSDALKEWA